VESLVFYTYQDYQLLTQFDFGPVAPRSSDDVQMQVINTSQSYQAADVIVNVDDGDDAAQLLLSLEGDTFGVSINVGTIPPGAGCVPFWLRRVTPSDATGIGSASLLATPTAWTEPVDTSTSDNVGLDSDTDNDVTDFDPTTPPSA
jgi:hypothetical protein